MTATQRLRIAALVTVLCVMACGGTERPPVPGDRAAVAGTDGMPAITEPFVVDGHAIIQTGAVGPLRVGEWRRPALSFVYALGATAGRDSSDVIVVRGIGKDTMTVVITNDTVRQIIVNRPGPHTADGIRIGTPLANLRTSRGARVESVDGARVLTLDRLCGIAFATDTFVVSEDTAARRAPRARDTSTVRAIVVGRCKR